MRGYLRLYHFRKEKILFQGLINNYKGHHQEEVVNRLIMRQHKNVIQGEGSFLFPKSQLLYGMKIEVGLNYPGSIRCPRITLK